MLRMRWLSWVAVVLAAAGCFTGCDLDGGGGADAGIGLGQYAVLASDTFCAKVYECCTQAEVPDASVFAPDQPTCQANLQNYLMGRADQIAAEQDLGRLAYHGDRFAECLSQYEGATCEAHKTDPTADFPPCRDYLEPRVAPGLNCRLDESCIGGLCVGETSTADGICRALVGEGQSCANGTGCGLGLYCDTGPNQCVAKKAINATCNANGECVSGACNANVCGPRGGTGTTCYATTGCSSSGNALWLAAVIVLVGLAIAAPRRKRSS